jgi:hypothetical protein
VEISSASTQNIYVEVTAQIGDVIIVPTSDPVYMAFCANRVTPVPSNWNTASWTTSGTSYYATCLVGSQNGGVNLATGTYVVWIKISDSPEIPVLSAGYLNIV